MSGYLDPSEILVDIVEDKPAGGMWHTGPNRCWITATHLPTMQSVRVYDGQQHRGRDRAYALLDLMLDGWDGDLPSFPESITHQEPET